MVSRLLWHMPGKTDSSCINLTVSPTNLNPFMNTLCASRENVAVEKAALCTHAEIPMKKISILTIVLSNFYTHNYENLLVSSLNILWSLTELSQLIISLVCEYDIIREEICIYSNLKTLHQNWITQSQNADWVSLNGVVLWYYPKGQHSLCIYTGGKEEMWNPFNLKDFWSQGDKTCDVSHHFYCWVNIF